MKEVVVEEDVCGPGPIFGGGGFEGWEERGKGGWAGGEEKKVEFRTSLRPPPPSKQNLGKNKELRIEREKMGGWERGKGEKGEEEDGFPFAGCLAWGGVWLDWCTFFVLDETAICLRFRENFYCFMSDFSVYVSNVLNRFL